MGKSSTSVIPYGRIPLEKTHAPFLFPTTSSIPTPFFMIQGYNEATWETGLISANRVNGINCFIGVTDGTRMKGAAKCLSLLMPAVTMFFCSFNSIVSRSNNDSDNTEEPW